MSGWRPDPRLRPGPLLEAYARGAFPMDSPELAHEPVSFYVADPRAVIPVQRMRTPRSVARAVRRRPYRIEVDRDFGAVVRACADRVEGTWLTPRLVDAYLELHRVGHAHSVECWDGDLLVGGVYGVSLGGLFTGESMFHTAPDAGNVALWATGRRLLQRGYALWDIQTATAHTARFGAEWVSQDDYLAMLRGALTLRCRFADPP